MKLLFLDLETTGTDYTQHGIHQIAGFVKVDGRVLETFNYQVQPHQGAIIDPKALELGGITMEDLQGYVPMYEVYRSLLAVLGRHVDKYSKMDKFHFVGYNSAFFDMPFLRKWFERNQDKYFGSWFWSAPLDVMILAADFLKMRRQDMENFQLRTVATALGIRIEESRLHDALYDIQLTEAVYEKVCRN